MDDKTKQLVDYSGEAKEIVAPVLGMVYHHFDHANFTVWAATMEWALKGNEVYEVVDPDGDELMEDSGAKVLNG